MWRLRRKFRVPAHISRDLSLVRQALASDIADTIWSRPIGLLVPRVPHATSFTDASYEGLGGYCAAIPFKWRISSRALAAAGWPVLTAEPSRYLPFPKDKLHINILEFLAVFIHTFLLLHLSSSLPRPPGGWVFHHKADNTSALGWISHASRSRHSIIQNVTRAYAAMLTFCLPSSFTITSSHIPGKLNVGADALSRPYQFSTWAAVYQAEPSLAPLPLYQVPSALLLHLRSIVLQPATGDQLERATLELLGNVHLTSTPGARPKDSMTPRSNTLHRRKRARSSRRTRKRSRKAKD